MCEIQDFPLVHKDIYLHKYSDRTANMDLYITDSLQDMLDMDIKSEMATDLGSVTDFSDTLGLNFSEMPPLLDMDTDNSASWLTTSSVVHNFDIYESEANGVMVNPNSVMPTTFSETHIKQIIKEEASNVLLTSTACSEQSDSSAVSSPKETKSHLTFSPSTLKVTKVKETEKPITKKLEEATQMVIYVRKDTQAVKDLLNDFDNKKIKTNHSITPVRIKSNQTEIIKINNKNCSILSNQKQIGTKTIISGNIHILDAQQSRTILGSNAKNQATILIDNSSLNNNRQIIKTSMNGTFTDSPTHTKYVMNTSTNKSFIGEFPKPAYSYSCLIAMALKNSRTGSLPVSEIYNFMCQHFPYFKTAPNGWKNSVRHNLSLNKCFEKIEKPSTNGNQRKGCLWAMNPTKIGKMDEEVLKWSRKDPQAIRKAMVYPDNLEALEKGEMKYSYAAAEGELEECEDADVDTEMDADGDIDLDADVKEEPEDEDIAAEQDMSEQELDVDEVVEGTGMVGGSYRLLTSAPSGLSSYIADFDSAEDASDVEVLDHSYDEVVDIELARPVKFDFSFSDEYNESSAKRPKSTFVYRPVATSTHTNRRKTPLVNRVL